MIDQLPEATMLRIETANGKREVYSLLRNRAHSNVAFLLGEAYRYQPGLDTVTIYPGVLSSYPNFMFNIPARQVPEFVAQMEQAKDAKSFEKIVDRWVCVAVTRCSGSTSMTCRDISTKPRRWKRAYWT